MKSDQFKLRNHGLLFKNQVASMMNDMGKEVKFRFLSSYYMQVSRR